MHGSDVALVGGALVPVHRLGEVLRDALAALVEAAEAILGDRYAAGRRALVPVGGGGEILPDAAAFRVAGSDLEGSRGIARGRGGA